MNKCGTPSPEKEPPALIQAPDGVADLDLPVAPGFAAAPPRRTLAEMLPWLAQMRQWFPQSRPSPEARLADKCPVEFIL